MADVFGNDLDPGDHEVHPDDHNPDDFPDLPHGIPATARTQSFRAFLDTRTPESIVDRCRETIEFMAERQLDLTLLLYYCTAWVLPEGVDDPVIQYARTALMWSDELPTMLKNWHRPPRKHATGISTKAANDAIEGIALSIVHRKINAEMRDLAPIMLSPPSELNEESLLVEIPDMIVAVQKTAPTIWSIMQCASCTPRQQKENTYKDPSLVRLISFHMHIALIRTNAQPILMAISTASYACSHHRCKFQKLLGIYFNACDTSARGLDTLHALGISMSQSWIYQGLEALSEAANKALREAIVVFPWSGGHDNMNIASRAYQQRLDNANHFDSGTIATVFIHHSPDTVCPSNKSYQEQWAIGSKNPITPQTIYQLDLAAGVRIREQAVYQVLNMLKIAAPFDFKTYEHKDSPVFSPPIPVLQLPTGPEHRTDQYMLDAVHIDEASYQGNASCFEEWWKQLDIITPEAQKEMAAKKLILWKGDQLTANCLRGLKRYNSHDLNAWERWDHILEVFGWFHAQMIVRHSFHQQYYGTTAGMGLKRDFHLLKRKGLTALATQGNFYQTLSKAIRHVAEARFRDLWCVVAEVDSIKDLRDLAPERLEALANTIVDKFASTAGLQRHRVHTRAKPDDLLNTQIQFNRDILEVIFLEDAIESGDVGMMKLLLPRLLYRFVGGGHNNYTVEILETMQGLEREWPDDLQ